MWIITSNISAEFQKQLKREAKSRPAIYLSDSLSPQTKIRSLEETVRLETRSQDAESEVVRRNAETWFPRRR